MAELTDSSFYVTGGTLRQDAACYVERQADRDLLDGLLKGEFCYVLTSRQMGKSSLMVRTAGKLREQGVRVAVLDLTAVGQPETKEQWYFGLLTRLGVQTRLEDELEEFWLAHPALAPVQRFFAAIHEVLLAKGAVISNQFSVISQSPATDSVNSHQLVIFVDELDVVRSLSFSTDEFFAAMRECYTRRTEDPEFNRLAFCLLGVATPSDLIRDTRITPFNIGRRIELNDFTPQEAAPLADGLKVESSTLKVEGAGTSQATLDRILYWTNGHPYLTQRLCQAFAAHVSQCKEARSKKSEIDQSLLASAATKLVDGLCAELFFAARAREQDDNLLFVRERLLRSDADLATLLQLYEQFQRGKLVPDEEANPMVSVLRLSGVVRSHSGQLVQRNRIYEHVFDRDWIHTNMPDAELRRQRTAFRRGLARAASVAFLVLALVAGLALVALRQAHRAEDTAKVLRKNLYLADMGTVQQALQENNLGRAATLVNKYFPQPGEEDLRGFEWRYLWKLCQGDELLTFAGHEAGVSCVVFSPLGRLAATASLDGTVKLWDITSKKLVSVLAQSKDEIDLQSLAFSPDGRFLTALTSENIIVWNTSQWQEVSRMESGPFAFSRNGRTLAARTRMGIILWETETWQKTATMQGGRRSRYLAFSPDGRTLAASYGNQIQLWDIEKRTSATSLLSDHKKVWSLAFSPTGNLLATGSNDGNVQLWDTSIRKAIRLWKAHANWALGLAFSPDGKVLATGGNDQVIRLWSVAVLQELGRMEPDRPKAAAVMASLGTLKGHFDQVWALAFSPDGQMLLSGCQDGTAKLWSALPKPPEAGFTNATDLLWLSNDGRTLTTLNSNLTVQSWDVNAGKATNSFTLPGAFDSARSCAISSDGKLLASVLTNGLVELWDIEKRTNTISLKGHTASVVRLKFSTSNHLLATVGRDGTARVWDIPSGLETARFNGSFGFIGFSPDERFLALSASDHIELMDLSTQRERARLRGFNRDVGALTFSPDGKFLAVGSHDSIARVWYVPSGELYAIFKGHTAGIYALAFAPDGKTMATAGNDDTVKMWNMATRQEVMSLKEFAQDAGPMMFSGDGTTLALGGAMLEGGGTKVGLWRAPSFADIEAHVRAGQQATQKQHWK